MVHCVYSQICCCNGAQLMQIRSQVKRLLPLAQTCSLCFVIVL